MRALIVDDEEDIGLMVSRFLEKEGLEVDYADRVVKARDLIQSSEYEIFFLDLNLPDGTGFDLMADIRDHSADARVVIISAYDGVFENRKAKELSINHFIKKPFTKKQVLEVIPS
ncbi:response regulator [Reichenbachiella ulvae]|uniref:Response regulator n=1 Tax=Reichenbachiella ulvae TaxID=2980104 RepID=A0ABT3CPA1_9BACT|nr:response regulator [Reichenbachiella ulvae]MCV9385442.1 response regulator [Reichenbachiella ulvae]